MKVFESKFLKETVVMLHTLKKEKARVEGLIEKQKAKEELLEKEKENSKEK